MTVPHNPQHPQSKNWVELIAAGRAPRATRALSLILDHLSDHRWHHYTALQAVARVCGIPPRTAHEILWDATRAGLIIRDRPTAPHYYRMPNGVTL